MWSLTVAQQKHNNLLSHSNSIVCLSCSWKELFGLLTLLWLLYSRFMHLFMCWYMRNHHIWFVWMSDRKTVWRINESVALIYSSGVVLLNTMWGIEKHLQNTTSHFQKYIRYIGSCLHLTSKNRMQHFGNVTYSSIEVIYFIKLYFFAVEKGSSDS